MGTKAKIDGNWNDSVYPLIKVGNIWKAAKSAWINTGNGWKSWYLQGGVLDEGFREGNTTKTGIVYTMALQPDGKILLGGSFTSFKGVSVNRIIRLNSDGSIDPTFLANIGVGASGTIWHISLQPNGQILVGGEFITFAGTTVNRVVRLNNNGTVDSVFTANIAGGFANTVYKIVAQPNGQILISGLFTTFKGVTRNRLVRVQSNGAEDTAFYTNLGTAASGSVEAIGLQSDGKIIVGGLFTTWNGVTVNGIVRLQETGVRDTSFATGTGASNVIIYVVHVQPDNKILVGGNFTSFNGTTTNQRIVRLNENGATDTSFTTNLGASSTNAWVRDFATTFNGQIIVVGMFTVFGLTTVNRVVRLNNDGTVNDQFTTNAGSAANAIIHSAVIQPDRKVLLSGDFSSFNSLTFPGVTRVGGEIPV
jgi:uncharacterized delta-60 repeat protein